MPKAVKSITAIEVLEILKKQWLNTKDVQKLANVGATNAKKIKENITKKILDEGYFLPNGLIPSEEIVKYLNINIKYLKKISKQD